MLCSEATLVHGPSGTLVGEDELGNRYYENNNNQVGKSIYQVTLMHLQTYTLALPPRYTPACMLFCVRFLLLQAGIDGSSTKI